MQYTNFDQLPLVLTVEDLTAILGIGRNTAYDLIRSEKLKSVRVGNQIRIAKSALQEFLNQ